MKDNLSCTSSFQSTFTLFYVTFPLPLVVGDRSTPTRVSTLAQS